MKASRCFSPSLLASLALLAGSTAALAQAPTSPAPAPAAGSTTVRTGSPQRDTLTRLMRRISVDFNEKRLEDIVSFIKDFANADIEALWVDDRNPEGLDKEKVISVKVDNVTVLALIEKVLERAAPDAGGEATWQMTETGTFQMGPRERLNKHKRVQIYDINDLLMDVPDYRDVPQIDLQQALQASQGGGGGGQSPFRDQQQQEDQDERNRRKQELTDELTTLIRDLVEPEQWVENGGSGGSIKNFRGSLIINAPDYMHRGINGYRYWPASKTIAMKDQQGRRYVTLGVDTGISTVDGFGQQPVTAVVGGQPVSSNPGGGGNKFKPLDKNKK
jgi:hypothetical protein